MMSFRTALELGRVSSLPTLWTNVLAGVALATLEPRWVIVIPVAIGASLLHFAGAYLNDAFDARWDAEHQPRRPIPAGEASPTAVFRAGFAMMAAAIVVLAATTNRRAVLAGIALAALIVLYDATHKHSRFAPIIIALCRVAVYALAAAAAGNVLAPPVCAGAGFLFLYVVTLTMIARQEPKQPRLVGRLIAGISLVDGVQLLVIGHPLAALACAGAFVLTLRLQRVAAT